MTSSDFSTSPPPPGNAAVAEPIRPRRRRPKKKPTTRREARNRLIGISVARAGGNLAAVLVFAALALTGVATHPAWAALFVSIVCLGTFAWQRRPFDLIVATVVGACGLGAPIFAWGPLGVMPALIGAVVGSIAIWWSVLIEWIAVGLAKAGVAK